MATIEKLNTLLKHLEARIYYYEMEGNIEEADRHGAFRTYVEGLIAKGGKQ